MPACLLEGTDYMFKNFQLLLERKVEAIVML